ncbi:hypothetical protein T492DRAFT_846779 [Pavlovales sp. CCMP2436]|nr:hypothetical protein T492DRAFT_846779 [Pavlovales sp. CCMP2436]
MAGSSRVVACALALVACALAVLALASQSRRAAALDRLGEELNWNRADLLHRGTLEHPKSLPTGDDRSALAQGLLAPSDELVNIRQAHAIYRPRAEMDALPSNHDLPAPPGAADSAAVGAAGSDGGGEWGPPPAEAREAAVAAARAAGWQPGLPWPGGGSCQRGRADAYFLMRDHSACTMVCVPDEMAQAFVQQGGQLGGACFSLGCALPTVNGSRAGVAFFTFACSKPAMPAMEAQVAQKQANASHAPPARAEEWLRAQQPGGGGGRRRARTVPSLIDASASGGRNAAGRGASAPLPVQWRLCVYLMYLCASLPLLLLLVAAARRKRGEADAAAAETPLPLPALPLPAGRARVRPLLLAPLANSVPGEAGAEPKEGAGVAGAEEASRVAVDGRRAPAKPLTSADVLALERGLRTARKDALSHGREAERDDAARAFERALTQTRRRLLGLPVEADSENDERVGHLLAEYAQRRHGEEEVPIVLPVAKVELGGEAADAQLRRNAAAWRAEWLALGCGAGCCCVLLLLLLLLETGVLLGHARAPDPQQQGESGGLLAPPPGLFEWLLAQPLSDAAPTAVAAARAFPLRRRLLAVAARAHARHELAAGGEGGVRESLTQQCACDNEKVLHGTDEAARPSAGAEHPESGRLRPNVLLFLAADLGYVDTSPFVDKNIVQ